MRSARSRSKSSTSKYDLLQMWGLVLGGGASSTLLPSCRTAGLIVLTTLSTYCKVLPLKLQKCHLSLVPAAHQVHREAKQGHGRVDYHDAAT